jgi:deoxycytidylate deaminase/dephospho-CoA kinase
MATMQQKITQVIGLTGSFGSGCSYIAKNVFPKEYQRISLSDVLWNEYQKAHREAQRANAPREALQDFGDELRKNRGKDYLAEVALREINQGTCANGDKRIVVDSIRNPAEVHYLRKQYPGDFFLFGVYASQNKRWERVKNSNQYHGDWQKFQDDDQRDCGRHSEEFGQRVEDCFVEADVVFANEEKFSATGNEAFQGFEGRVKGFIKLVETRLSRQQPTLRESLMAAAYTISQRSSCMQRKVGALIVDDEENIVSSGFNEVPRQLRPCVKEFNMCGRKKVWLDVESKLRENFPELNGKHDEVVKFLRGELKILDNCHSLHAEENAIINLARTGRSIPLETCTLYTTTYPCRLCANKIVNLGLRRIIYLEPYPDPVAKEILGNQVKDEFFEGVTFKAYSRIYGEKK